MAQTNPAAKNCPRPVAHVAQSIWVIALLCKALRVSALLTISDWCKEQLSVDPISMQIGHNYEIQKKFVISNFIVDLYTGHSKFLNLFPKKGFDLSARSTYKQVGMVCTSIRLIV